MSLLAYRVHRLLRWLYHRATVVLYSLDLSRPSTPAPVPRQPIRIEPISEHNLELARAMEPAHRIDRFRKFLHEGDTGFFALLDGRVVHRSWVQFGPRIVQQHHDLAPYELKPGEAYIHFCETAPSARGLGIYPAMLAHILAVLRDRGLATCYIATTTNNIPSRRGIEKVGFRPLLLTEVSVVLGHIRRSIKPACVAS